MKSRFETTKEEDERAKMVLEEVLNEAYNAGARLGLSLPHPDELWEKLLQILGIGEWDDKS